MRKIVVPIMMRLILISIFGVVTGLSANAGGVTVYPTLPGTNFRDYSRPGAQVEDKTIYFTIPGTNFRDYSRPGLKIESDED
jgi:hypothetical protein